ncbi:hypothetical protein FEDK69T_31170 [Flavobacterium enshiense DK69]|uniref:Carboxypeptidase regulatory-like domain-containing protein n=1 Tax=Flavobacterium enshiense DK69 TaxID=1107311 RepID=V6S641_9FLAO|nr:carboxypeptidase-like regulatory domain-containing protein [Flavobacterium enshiense]ESU19860.1 hypothetical protein FEDK69T_31170 [Flavobacterium enshiense DK69]KGO92297.1 hypothetical protein Q767_15665 [Flavobacterium enshiense DK69]
MKKITYLIILLFINNLFSQTATLKGKVFDGLFCSECGFSGVVLVLKDKDGKTYGAQTDTDGNYKIENLKNGVYTLNVNASGLREKVYENFIIDSSEQKFEFIYPEPCVKSIKRCPKQHTDNIIPIVYGLPSKRTMIKAEKGKVKLGGCDSSFCEKWFCKTHNISF